ncbi:zinc finger protein 709-like [Topomyia yanbarensis]|uniref:zinc finger protein 709-like n=1 Tax=Topomyia yanbarensis TaxID=2498891 RepID=UPI00273B007C|nr:zinc finger protein 709-like [Topomyia yanbarensis]
MSRQIDGKESARCTVRMIHPKKDAASPVSNKNRLIKAKPTVDMAPVCRICARTGTEQDMSSIDSQRSDETIANMISDCGGVLVSLDDTLPQSVCSTCLGRVEDAYNLRKLIRTSGSSLRAMSSQLNMNMGTATQQTNTERLITKKADKYVNYPTKDQIERVDKFEDYDVIHLKGFRCCGCQMIFTSKLELKEHSIRKHYVSKATVSTITAAFQCPTCYERFPNRIKLLNHSKSYESNEIYHCTLCDVVFDIKYRLEQHQSLSKAHRNQSDVSTVDHVGEEPKTPTKLKIRSNIRKRVTKELKLPSEEFIISTEDTSEYQILHIGGERCCGCDLIFRNYQELVDHCTVVHPSSKGEAMFECTLCSEQFDQVQSFNRHNSARTQKELYYCKLCDLVIDVRFRFDQHLKSSVAHQAALKKLGIKSAIPLEERMLTENRALEAGIDIVDITDMRCCGCNFVCSDKAELEKHSEEKHGSERVAANEERTPECNVCFKRFSSPVLLKYHHNASLQSTVYKCKQCDLQSEIKYQVMQHVASGVHPPVEKKAKSDEIEKKVYACCFAKCTLVFENSSDLLEHVKNSHASKRRENAEEREFEDFICYVCHKSFRNEKSLQIHQFPRRTEGHVCRTCGATFLNLSTFMTHEKTHYAIREFQCDLCDKAFYDERALRVHKVCHNEERPYVCDICSKSFLRKGNLKVHKRCHSQGIWECTHCQEKFKTKQSLVLHIRYHTGEKPYQCRYCENRYSHTTDRQRHEMAAHTKVRPHKCAKCPAAFIRKRQLTIHERTHTGERPYVCHICDKGFIQNNFLTKHLASHEKDDEEMKEPEYAFELVEVENVENDYLIDVVEEQVIKAGSDEQSDEEVEDEED